MKKTMILALAVLGIVGFSVTANAEPCDYVGQDQYECDTYYCAGSGCIFRACGQSGEQECPE